MAPPVRGNPAITRIPVPDYRVHPAYGGLFGAPPLADRLRALRRLLPVLWMQVKIYAHTHRRRCAAPLPALAAPLRPLLDEFRESGAFVRTLPAADLAMLANRSAPYLAAIDAHKRGRAADARRFMDKVWYVKRAEDPALYRTIEDVLERGGIFAVASHYRGAPVRLFKVHYQSNDPTDPDWRDHFRDANHPDPASAYLHMDSSMRRIRCLIYLNEVGAENGAFRLILGSHRLPHGFDYLVRKANDLCGLDKCDLETRRLFAALPRALQRKAEFGNDLDGGDPEVRALLAAEREFTSAAGNCIVFDTDGLHRGGMVREGTRRLLQITLDVEDAPR